ncbi:MAG: HD domain-containing protein [Ruminococcus sp.]|nr:HD domain-containing protein [Ruminococcus sp.]
MTLFYDLMLALSLALSTIYLFMWHRHFDVHITLVFVLVPVTNLGFSLFARSQDLHEALLAQKLTYIGGSYLLMFIMFMVFSLCHIKLNRIIRVSLMLLSSLMFSFVLTIGFSDVFYKSGTTFELVNGNARLNKNYGYMHTVFMGVVIAYFALSFFAILHSYLRKNQVSRKMIYLLFLSEVVAIVAYFSGRSIIKDVQLLPAAYVFAQSMYLIIVYKIGLYNVTDTAIDSMVESGDTGFVSIDFKRRYLGSNKTARKIFPYLEKLTVDKPITKIEDVNSTFVKWLDDFVEDSSKNKLYFEKDNKIYLVNITYLFDGRKNRGYQFFITDDTKNQQYIKLIDSFNDELRNEVYEKTNHIIEMHDKLVMSMATMVERRDNSTGGHIKRTSMGVRLLTDEMKKAHYANLDEEFYNRIIKAAPMHDLGKIAVDDAILRKPGKYEPWEFEQMKAHAAEGAKIVHEILSGTDDHDFHIIAENVAHYHHERWDGSGYPNGLKADEIPIEARIMAIADVYDALVSKRVYKEKMSFKDANKIILDGMGTQFDKMLEPFYLRARPKLEEYYSSIEC